MIGRHEAGQRIRDLEAELAAANARIAELENILAWSGPADRVENAKLRERLAEAEAWMPRDRPDLTDYQPGQNAHVEGKEAA